MSHVGECGVSEKKRGPREGGGPPRVREGGPPRVREGGTPRVFFFRRLFLVYRTNFWTILAKMPYPQSDTKIPLRVVYPLSPLRVRDPPSPTREVLPLPYA